MSNWVAACVGFLSLLILCILISRGNKSLRLNCISQSGGHLQRVYCSDRLQMCTCKYGCSVLDNHGKNCKWQWHCDKRRRWDCCWGDGWNLHEGRNEWTEIETFIGKCLLNKSWSFITAGHSHIIAFSFRVSFIYSSQPPNASAVDLPLCVANRLVSCSLQSIFCSLSADNFKELAELPPCKTPLTVIKSKHEKKDIF